MENSIKKGGLSSKEVNDRRKKFGYNSIKNKKSISPVLIFLQQFNDFMVWVLIAATLISGFMGDKADAITIIIIVIMNAILGFIQEFRTEKSLEALNEMAAPTSKVIRDGRVKIINSQELVPGDLILIESGDRIPADCVLIENSNLMVDEALLTGESVGVLKNLSSNNKMFMGTTALTGKGEAVVTEIGMETEMGKIAHMLHSIEDEVSPLKEKLNQLGKILVVICVGICAVVTALGIFRGQDVYEMFLLGVSLAVAAIPEGLAAIVTVVLALGVSRMLKKNALVRRLPAVETLGCTSIICSDKTGTLTQNVMTAVKVYTDNKIQDVESMEIQSNNKLKEVFTYCNDCNYDFKEKNISKALFGDPTETALIKAFFKNTKELEKHLNSLNRIFSIPFDSSRKMMSVLGSTREGDMSFVKGAPERVIDKCSHILINGTVKPMTDIHKREIHKAIDAMARDALRCLAGAYKKEGVNKNNLESGLIFVGVMGIIDPPREEVKEAVIKCKRAGITPVMITGDHKNTAFAIARELMICNDEKQVMTGAELDKISDDQLYDRLNTTRVFARVSPHHKFRIVKLFKSMDKVVAMTGDGVNDAPAIKESDIGIAMGIQGTDVTKEASSMILLDDNFATIVSAIEEGRVIYSNIRKFIRYLLSCNLGEVLTMLLASIYGLQTPLLPIQILFVNLATDGLPAMALGMDPSDKDAMGKTPREKSENIFARGLKEKILIRGTLIGACTILAFVAGLYYGYDLKVCRTLALGTLITSQLVHVFECKSEDRTLFQINIFDNLYLVAAVAFSLSMMVAIVYVPFLSEIFHTAPLNAFGWGIIAFFSLIIAVVNGVVQVFTRKKR